MARLDACYFCGTGEDAPLSEVTVTPRRRQDDPEAAVTLTLCPSCERKLERVLGGLFDHVESRRVADESADGEAEPEPVDRIDVGPGRETADEPSARPTRPRPPADRGGSAGDAGADDAEIVDDEPRVRATATANPGVSLDGVSVAEYNRVMRLLQNREFPMGRAAFVDLAANAYDLREETVEKVLDAVIDQGSLDEREGQLVRPGQGESA